MDSQGIWDQRVAEGLAEAIESLQKGKAPERILARCIGEALNADLWSVGYLDCPTQRVDLEVWPQADARLMRRASKLAPQLHPVLDHWLQGHADATVVSALVTDWHSWRNSAWYDLLRRELGCAESGGIRLNAGTTSIHCIGIARERALTSLELLRLGHLQAPMVAIVAHSRWLKAQQAHSDWPTKLVAAKEHRLSNRELAVLELLGEGLIASAIARRLRVSTRTVHRHVAHLYEKLGQHDRLSAVLYAQRVGLMAAPSPVRPFEPADGRGP